MSVNFRNEALAKQMLGKYYTPPKPAKRPTGESKKKQSSQGEKLFEIQLQSQSIPFTTEFKFCDDRRWRADFRINHTVILVEIEGGTWTGGRHTRGDGYEKDCEKYNWAMAHGWIVLRFTTGQVKKGDALKAVSDLLGRS